MTKCQITCKSLQKSSKCQDFQRVWHLVIFWAEQSKNHPVPSKVKALLPPQVQLQDQEYGEGTGWFF